MESLSKRFEKEVFEPYREFLKSEYRFHPKFAHAEKIWEQELTFEELVNGPYLEKARNYAIGASLDQIAIHEKTKSTILDRLNGNPLYQHQTEAINLILQGRNAVVATGTSSGKTLCYQIPILDDLLQNPSPGLRAIIIYPLNALVNDQLEEWERMLAEHDTITFARFTGQTPKNQIEYEARLKEIRSQNLKEKNPNFTQGELQRAVQKALAEEKENSPKNRLNHRAAIRDTPPNVLVTNFSMLEYLLERPVDAPIFEDASLKFIVLDEVHAYRGVQATEIGFLVRRLKDRLRLETLTCIATSATLGDKNDPKSREKVRKFVSDLFDEDFAEPNPIYGASKIPTAPEPSFCPSPRQYIEAVQILREDDSADLGKTLSTHLSFPDKAELLIHDGNLFELRRNILTAPTLLKDAANQLFPNDENGEDGLQALLEIVASAKKDEAHEDLLPTRLHYFVRSQDGLHVCLRSNCPTRKSETEPSFFVSRQHENVPEGLCPNCFPTQQSQLVEIVTCRKCGYLFGALQDLGPRRARNEDNDETSIEPQFDSFSTELGWAADSFWSYFSVEDDLPFPPQIIDEEDDDSGKLILDPAQLNICVQCGKKEDIGRGDNCKCEKPHLRKIFIFHRQCPDEGKAENLYIQEKKVLSTCPNCSARNASGLEPVRRFQKSEDETGLAMAIPFSHFQVSSKIGLKRTPRKLLCFTDHRQRAAAFPSLLEESTFTHDLGRKIVNLVEKDREAIDFESLAENLADAADPNAEGYDPDFFLPVSRFPDDELSHREKRKLWTAEVFSYFGIPDSARESAEDLGLVAVEYYLNSAGKKEFQNILPQLTPNDSGGLLQTILSFVRHRKAFTLPSGVSYDSPAFGRMKFEKYYTLRREGQSGVEGWLPRLNKDGSFRHNYVTDYLKRVLRTSDSDTLEIGERLWKFFVTNDVLIERRDKFQLDHEKLLVGQAKARFLCDRCNYVTVYSAKSVCPRKGCSGTLAEKPFSISGSNLVERWVAGIGEQYYSTLKSEEHTAQINKDLAKRIEDEFRADGIDLLSSTTTFEMGINIGNLQKVLLRNAPPSSASYVQRVGRAGRGADKNAVSVTICRRTKYDSDMWMAPTRLMSGVVRPPTVFVQNKIIAQRHFNAVAFAKFLREKVADEKLLGNDVKQQTRLAAFLPVSSRKGIPADWIKLLPIDLYLDFSAWMGSQNEDDIFQTDSGKTLLKTLGDFDEAKHSATIKYGGQNLDEPSGSVLDEIVNELESLMDERKNLVSLGKEIGDVDRSIRNLLDSDVIAVLAKRGFLPRYAFPLDVVRLETGWSRWSTDSDVDLSRDRASAIAEFAPGAQVIAHKKVFTSAGLYVASKADRPTRNWYAKCPDCEQIRTSLTQEPLEGHCEVCGRIITTQYIKPFVEPIAFSIRMEKDKSSKHRRTSLVRQRQSLTHFIDAVPDEEFQHFELFDIALKKGGNLFRYNLGPQNKGFMLCSMCGCSEPLLHFKTGRKHRRLRAFDGKFECQNENPWTKPLAYGHIFQSYCLIIRPRTMLSIESLVMALRKGLCKSLDLESSDIGTAWRWQANRKSGGAAELVLFDNTPGGAGFVQEALENWAEIEEAALELCQNCTCETACYECLKDYSNQSHHDVLDRNTVVDFFTA